MDKIARSHSSSPLCFLNASSKSTVSACHSMPSAVLPKPLKHLMPSALAAPVSPFRVLQAYDKCNSHVELLTACGTSLPSFMMAASCLPCSDPLFTSSRSRSPADRCVQLYLAAMRSHWVPLPLPGLQAGIVQRHAAVLAALRSCLVPLPLPGLQTGSILSSQWLLPNSTV